MEFEHFEELLRTSGSRRLGGNYPEEFTVFDSWRATDAELRRAESELGVRLPEKYKRFMRTHGGGVFMFVDLLPVASPDGRAEDLLEVNVQQISRADFIAVSPVGTGDWWGFSPSGEQRVCPDTVFFLDHDDGSMKFAFPDFFDFLVEKGLGMGAGR